MEALQDQAVLVYKVYVSTWEFMDTGACQGGVEEGWWMAEKEAGLWKLCPDVSTASSRRALISTNHEMRSDA